MKGLALDTSITKISIAAKNDDHSVTASYDIGMKQSETLLPAISYVLEKAGMTAAEIEYTAICQGPGSFTGLRLGYAAVKALECASKAPIYGISTLKANAYPYNTMGKPVLALIDAKKDRFYAGAWLNEKELFPEGDYPYEKLAELINNSCEKEIILAGPVGDCKVFLEAMSSLINDVTFISPCVKPAVTDSLFILAEEMISNKLPPLQEYDGPVYLRASEAEENISKTK
ncbi:MAG: tRNA (adenosine(37)-N6)-threonylcarbamoyltransferase complex dimerization subunit type 1 TsaB [Treponema sp.]|nr:tRNA (adenosine(37)-N6)-threonylcarbamoyltransferase complex dimerization subunit type 1 TsaB [Treponema sp.]